ncbi:hypothetical protein ACFFQF_05485 [Haladaptatus pallidirubidus]|uniref:DUF2127 domain-containing protein n=1 Tax=Haladaptatus pallidirubidus TaxID=1008152 RepID=A0AAV3ULL5_9EURY|nr:hypothetical protein [Haladaptatus pallidirubidus]
MGTSHSYGRTQSAPLGIKILCILGAISGIFGIFGGLGTLFSSPFGIVVGTLAIAFSLAKLVVVWGLWTLQSWAWMLTVVVYGIGLLLDVLNLMTGNLFAIFSIIVGGLLLAYVYSKHDYYR